MLIFITVRKYSLVKLIAEDSCTTALLFSNLLELHPLWTMLVLVVTVSEPTYVPSYRLAPSTAW